MARRFPLTGGSERLPAALSLPARSRIIKKPDHEEAQVHGRADYLRSDANGDLHAGEPGHLWEGVSGHTFCRLKKTYIGAGSGEMRRLTPLEDESGTLNGGPHT